MEDLVSVGTSGVSAHAFTSWIIKEVSAVLVEAAHRCRAFAMAIVARLLVNRATATWPFRNWRADKAASVVVVVPVLHKVVMAMFRMFQF